MKKIIDRPYESEASYLLNGITDKGTSIEDMNSYSFLEPIFEFSNCWAYEVKPGIIELVDENFISYGLFEYKFDKCFSRVYLTSLENGEQGFYDIIN